VGRESVNAFSGLTVGELIDLARREIAREDDGPLSHLVALHQHPTRQVFDAAVGLLGEQDSLNRELGARILRELGEEVNGRRPFGPEAVRVLVDRLAVEDSSRVVGWIVSALGYNGAYEELPAVLELADHADSFVRFHVAAAVPSMVLGRVPGPEVLDVLGRLAADPDSDVRFYAAYALLEEIEGVSNEKKDAVAEALTGDNDEQIRNLASSWSSREDDSAGGLP